MTLEQVCSLDSFHPSERIFAQAKGILAQARFSPKLKPKNKIKINFFFFWLSILID